MTRDDGRVAGKRVLITGAARGMGRSHAVRLAEEGADLILVDICESLPEVEYPLASRDDLDETARLVGEARQACGHPRRRRARRRSVGRRRRRRRGRTGRPGRAVANAGVLTVGTWDTTTPEQWRTVVDVNLIGTWNTCAAALPHLVERGGSLVNISSAAGIEGHAAAHPVHGVQARRRRVESGTRQ